MLLVAVSKDGNNNIFPLAWAVVEVENTESWTWFLTLLVEDLDNFPTGEGLTLMSDRQKGLLDAITTCVPKAEIRYYSTFVAEMECIKLLSGDAHAYLDAIDVKHWARHAFQTKSKSNMLLNNLCETFNGVLREARDKPIITCMEWIRRYVMRRSCEKLTGVEKQIGRLMPYVAKVFEWISIEAQNCFLVQSTLDEWEVNHKEQQHVVNLSARSCTCRKWELTGIPCQHAFACLVKRRQNPEDFVDDYYSKATYLKAYSIHVRPMPGMSQWEKNDMPKPLPPVHRKMPGKPSKKKRKKEVGEDEGRFVKKPKKPNNCSNCGQPGHNILKCKNPTTARDNKGGRPSSNDPWVKNQRQNKLAKALTTTSVANGTQEVSTSHNMQRRAPTPEFKPTKSATTSNVQPSQSSQAPNHRGKLQVKPKKKKKLEDIDG
ncbi:uncharacterized protein LOC104908537 [Beta vulgaris subsp. vulgaris]|uniref:uncharacterized protein LOC104908537 n=1 Tax=Beta vulgaris subsp. vulgaris TaxID=3555 RepID=UPI0020367188|nr:uncharacterized protein LOC104908537 [Beta vulgaris subsp. vulgaris]